MEKYVLMIFIFVALVAVSGILNNELSTQITGNAVRQKTQGVMIGKGLGTVGTMVPQQKKATTGLLIKDKTPYKVIMGPGNTMVGMVQVQGISLSENKLREFGIRLENGLLRTSDGKPVQLKEVSLRRKPIKLTFAK